MTSEVFDSPHWVYLYQLTFSDGRVLEFPVQIDKASHSYILSINEAMPAWANLSYHQCGNCPLSSKEVPICPVAANLIPLLELCGNMTSYDEVALKVATPERTVSANTTVQRVLTSLLGLVMATSPCPHTEYLKPMARFHLPLASEDETIYRTTSMYLLAQYFLFKGGKDYALELDNLTQIYNDLQIVNCSLANRFKAAVSEDGAINAIVLLNLLSQSVTWSIEDGLEGLRYLFRRYGVD
jgi:hypothetical protein